MLLADLHLGKVTHFRRRGLPVPAAASDGNWDKLLSLLLEFAPERVIFLGDLFHSAYNAEWDAFQSLISRFPGVRFELIPGNHDILPPDKYTGLIVQPQELEAGPFLLSHYPVLDPGPLYNLAGHVHPGVRLRGQGRQYLKLPCFYFGEKGGVLPAFGLFTGLGDIRPKAGDQVFVIAEGQVLAV